MLRDYQELAVKETFGYLNNTTGNGIIVMPTGTGKSHVIAEIAKRALWAQPNIRVHMLVDSQELIEQNLEKLLDAWPNAPVGVYSAGLKRKQMDFPIIYGGIQSMHKVVHDLAPPKLTLIDEAHMFGPSAEAMYGDYHKVMREREPYLRSVGLTATDWRLGLGRLTEPGSFFTDTIINLATLQNFNRFIDEGYIVKLIPRPTETKLDLTGVGLTGGEYNSSAMQKAVDKPEITWRALQELCHYGQNRRKWLLFASGVDHADHINEMLNGMGVSCTVVHRGVLKDERRQRIKDYKAGRYRAIVNNNILTKGFDDNAIDLIGVLRGTMSSALWVQMLGRGTRPLYAQGFDLNTREGRLLAIANSVKQNCLVLDFAGNAALLGPINDPVIPRKASGMGGDAPVKICETKRLKAGYTGCGVYNHPSVRVCDNCGAEFDFSVKFGIEASVQQLIADGVDEFKWFDVKNVFYSSAVGPSGKPYLRVDYYVSKSKRFTEFVHLEQTKWMLHKARDWWRARAKHPPEWGVPPTVKDALPYCNRHYLKEPVKIRVWVNRQPYPEIVNYEYE